MKRSTKILATVAGVLVATATIYIGSQFYKNRPTLGNELYKEALQTQEKYRKLKAEGKTIKDFTQSSDLEEKVYNNVAGLETEYEAEPIEFYKDPTGSLYLQRASFKKEDNATKTVKKLKDKGFEANYFIKDNWYVVYLGPLNGIDDVLVAEDKFYLSYPDRYLLLKGPINTTELKIEKEKNLIRLSLVKASDCLKRNDSCIYSYIPQDHPDYEKFKSEFDNFRNHCKFKYFKYTPVNIKINLEEKTASLDIMFKAKVKCCDDNNLCEESTEEETEKDANFLKKEGKYIAIFK